MAAPSNHCEVLYLELVKRMLRRHGSSAVTDVRIVNWKRHLVGPVQRALNTRGVRLVSNTQRPRHEGETMVTSARLDNLQRCIEGVLADDVPGDLIETGVWRGGATILMRAVLAAHEVTDRCVWVADSFEGFPPKEARTQALDQGVDFTGGLGEAMLAVDLETVKRNFERYGLLDDQVRFLKGWFADTLPNAPLAQLAVLRLDCDLYLSTRDVLHALYAKVSPGGYVIVDDYGTYEACRRAVDEFRESERIVDPIEWIDDDAIFWRRHE